MALLSTNCGCGCDDKNPVRPHIPSSSRCQDEPVCPMPVSNMKITCEIHRIRVSLVLSLLVFPLGLTAADPMPADTKPLSKDKLQIVFLMGQSNMVGLADIGTSWYLTQPLYVPPRDLMLKKSESFDWNNLYWQGVRYYQGPPELEKELARLVDAREESRPNGANAPAARIGSPSGESSQSSRTAMTCMPSSTRSLRRRGSIRKWRKSSTGRKTDSPL
jgi:hypothetical protein